MGLKSGSRDAGLDKPEDREEQATSKDRKASENDRSEVDIESADQQVTENDSEATTAPESSPNSVTEETGSRPSMDSIPYKLRREKVNEGRDQVPFFLREEVIDAEDELQDTLEELLDENVYKSDYREAAMVVAQRNPEFVAEVLREWGYDLDAT